MIKKFTKQWMWLRIQNSSFSRKDLKHGFEDSFTFCQTRAGNESLSALLLSLDFYILHCYTYTTCKIKIIMGNKKENTVKKSLEAWARKELFDDELWQFLKCCDDIYSPDEIISEKEFKKLKAGFRR